MPDNHLLEDEAALYVTGELTDVERCEFEARMAGSAELRVLVRELEDGAVAMAMAMPRRRPPQQVWQQIEKAVAEETNRKVVTPSFWTVWLHNGWAAAAACLVGWLLYAMWMHRAGAPVLSPSQAATQTASEREAAAVNSLKAETGGALPQPPTMTNTGRQPQVNLAAQTKENVTLRRQVTDLENQVTHLSEMVTQQQALLSESSRLKFFQLAPASNGVSYANATPPAPELQRALLQALARELGWLRSADVNAGTSQESQSTHSNSTFTTQSGVDFVDLPPATSETANPVTSQSTTEVASNDTSESHSPASTSSNAIPVLVLGDRAIVAVSPTGDLQAGDTLTIMSGTTSQGYQLVGDSVLRNNITVVTFQLPDGMNFMATVSTPSGMSNTFVQPSAPVSPSP